MFRTSTFSSRIIARIFNFLRFFLATFLRFGFCPVTSVHQNHRVNNFANNFALYSLNKFDDNDGKFCWRTVDYCLFTAATPFIPIWQTMLQTMFNAWKINKSEKSLFQVTVIVHWCLKTSGKIVCLKKLRLI